MLNNFDLPMIIKHGEKGNPSQRVYLQRTSITTKIRFKSRYVKGESRVCKKKINIKHSKLWIRFTIRGSKNILITVGFKNP